MPTNYQYLSHSCWNGSRNRAPGSRFRAPLPRLGLGEGVTAQVSTLQAPVSSVPLRAACNKEHVMAQPNEADRPASNPVSTKTTLSSAQQPALKPLARREPSSPFSFMRRFMHDMDSLFEDFGFGS